MITFEPDFSLFKAMYWVGGLVSTVFFLILTFHISSNNNACPHIAKMTKETLAWELLPHQLHTADLDQKIFLFFDFFHMQCAEFRSIMMQNWQLAFSKLKLGAFYKEVGKKL